MQTSLYELLQSNHIFKAISRYEFSVIENYLFFKGLEADEFLFHEGSHGDFVAFVVAGQLEVFINLQGKKKQLAIKKTGDSIGDMAVIDELSRSASVRALERTGLIILPKRDFERILSEHPEIGIKMLKGLANMLSLQLRKANKS